MKLRKLVILAAGLMIAAPALTTLPGCNGGTSPLSLRVINNMAMNLGNGQSGSLNLTVRGTGVTGTLVIPTPPPSVGRPRAIAFQLPPGTYNLAGTFTAPLGFNVTGSFLDGGGQTVAFTITGTLPTTTEPGSFTFTSNGQTVDGTIPVLPAATPTPTNVGPTPTPT